MTEQPTDLKANLDFNETVASNADFLSTLKDKLPQFFTADKYDEETGELTEAGAFDFPKFQATLKENNVSDELSSGYRLDFIGKNLAKKQAGERPTTVIVPNKPHNDKPENKDSKNLFFTGDNLEVLRHLQSNYQNAVDFIYIDPPYNTGSDGFVYPDDFKYSDDQLKAMFALDNEGVKRLKSIQGRSSHSAWLAFMYPRLYLARKLLKETGVIFVSIDDNEQANLKLLMDEIFGEGSFVGSIVHQRAKGGGQAKYIVKGHDIINVFAKKISDFEPLTKPKVIQGKVIEIDGVQYLKNDDIYRKQFGKYETGTERRLFYEDALEVKGQKVKDEIDKRLDDGEIFLEERGDEGKHTMYSLEPVEDATSKLYSIIKVLSEEGKSRLEELEIADLFSYPKPVDLIKQLIQTRTSKDLLVLDFFAGSATTADAVLQLNAEDGGNRQFMMVQLPEEFKEDSVAYKAGYKTIDEISRTRIEKAAAKIKAENPLFAENGDLGFKHFTVKEVEINTLDKMIDFNPDVLLVEDLVAELDGGVDTLLTTWLTSDGYKFDEIIETVKFDEHTAYYIDKSLLYIIEKGWSAKATEDLVNALGTLKLNVNTIIVSEYALGFSDMTELKTNVKNISEPKVRVEVRG